MNKYAFVVAGGKSGPQNQIGRLLTEEATLTTGQKNLEERYGELTATEVDLLRLASAVFAADRASVRGEREDVTRKIELRIPVNDQGLFIPLAGRIEALLRELSQDIWRIQFIARRAKHQGPDDDEVTWPSECGKTLLFSGGLDSLAAAVEFSHGPKDLLLVSHRTHNQATDRAQKDLVASLTAAGRLVDHLQVFVSSRDGSDTTFVHDAEPSQRTRSFVFLVVGAICARRSGKHELLYMAENGQMAIHLPLTAARIGAFSTRTSHPFVLAAAEKLLSEALKFALKIHNPYLYLTKAEVVAKVWKELPHTIPLSTSCWKNARIAVTGATHCGECVPCIMRRIAIESSGKDTTSYARDAFSAVINKPTVDDEARRNLYDVAEFIALFRNNGPQALLMEFPDLINPQIDSSSAIAMYKRFADEATAVLGRYPPIGALLR